MSVPLILTILAGAATFIGAILGVLVKSRLTACWPFHWDLLPALCCSSL